VTGTHEALPKEKKEENKMNEKINIADLTLVSGIGDYSAHTACIMSAAVAKWKMEHGEELGGAIDTIDCVDSPIRGIAIAINDEEWWGSDKERTETLLPFIDQILGTKGSSELTQLRAYKCADYAVRVFLPIVLDLKKPEQAEYLRSLPEIVDVRTAIVGKNAAAAVSTGLYAAAAAAARTAAYAAASSATAAYADAAEDAAAAAYHAAEDASYAACYAAYHASHAAKIPTRTAALRLLTELCSMT